MAHLAIAVEGAKFNSMDSLNLLVASSVVGSYDRTYGAGKNLAGKLAVIMAGEPTVHCFESFYKRYSDTGLWWADGVVILLCCYSRICFGAAVIYRCCMQFRMVFCVIMYFFTHPSALTLLVGQQEGHTACKNWVVGCWRSYLSEARCRLAYDPADATATHCFLLQ